VGILFLDSSHNLLFNFLQVQAHSRPLTTVVMSGTSAKQAGILDIGPEGRLCSSHNLIACFYAGEGDGKREDTWHGFLRSTTAREDGKPKLPPGTTLERFTTLRCALGHRPE
jgi:ABC-type uncharacterized transport system permease subunit